MRAAYPTAPSVLQQRTRAHAAPRALQALRNALPRLAALRSTAASAVPRDLLLKQDPSVQWPWVINQNYPGAKISQPWGLSRPIYFLETLEEEHFVIKFVHGSVGIDIQKAWHQIGAAPEVVSAMMPKASNIVDCLKTFLSFCHVIIGM